MKRRTKEEAEIEVATNIIWKKIGFIKKQDLISGKDIGLLESCFICGKDISKAKTVYESISPFDIFICRFCIRSKKNKLSDYYEKKNKR